jgi:hypothetical protein
MGYLRETKSMISCFDRILADGASLSSSATEIPTGYQTFSTRDFHQIQRINEERAGSQLWVSIRARIRLKGVRDSFLGTGLTEKGMDRLPLFQWKRKERYRQSEFPPGSDVSVVCLH